MSFHDLSCMITEIRSTIPRVQLIQSTSYKTNLSHRSTTKTANRSHLQPTAYHICEISSLKPEAIALIPLLGHAEIKQNFSSNVVIPRSSRGRRPRGLPLDAQLRITDEARQLMQCSPLRSDCPGADRTTPLLVSTRTRRSTGGELLGSLRRQDCYGARVSNTWNDLTDQRLTLLGYCAPLYIGSEHGLHSRGPFTKAHIILVLVIPTH